MATTRKPARTAARSTAKKSAGKTTAKRARPKSRATTTAGSGKRELVENAAGAQYAKRAADGTFKEMDSRRRALASDVRTRAKTKSKPGYGDRGDR